MLGKLKQGKAKILEGGVQIYGVPRDSLTEKVTEAPEKDEVRHRLPGGEYSRTGIANAKALRQEGAFWLSSRYRSPVWWEQKDRVGSGEN